MFGFYHVFSGIVMQLLKRVHGDFYKTIRNIMPINSFLMEVSVI